MAMASWCSGSTSDSKSDNGGSIPSEVTFACRDRMAERSKAPDPSSGLFGGAGSNPAPVITFGGCRPLSSAVER